MLYLWQGGEVNAPRARGKAEERRVAKNLGASRVLRQGTSAPDVETDDLCVEVKNVSLRGIRGEWIEEIRAKAAKEGKHWLLVKRTKGQKFQVAVLDFAFFLSLYRKGGTPIDEMAAGIAELADDTGPEV